MESDQMILSRNPSSVNVVGSDLLKEFLRKCKDVVEPSNDLDRTLQKIRKKIAETDPVYKNSAPFVDLLQKIISKVSTEPWCCMKELSDALEHHSVRKSSRKKSANSETPVSGEENEKNNSQLKKLETVLAELGSKIRTLEQSEVNLADSDDENSNYMKLDRFKRRFCKIYDRINELKELVGDVIPKSIRFTGTKFFSINRAIEKFYNKNREFPDFHDVLNVVQTENKSKKLNLSQSEIRETAKEAFKELGRLLKLQREYDLHNTINSFLPDEMADDPALVDDELEKKLSDNKTKHGHKIEEVINEFVKRQDREYLEPIEISCDDELSIINDDEKTSDAVFSDRKFKNGNVSEWIPVKRQKYLEPIEIPSDDELLIIDDDDEKTSKTVSSGIEFKIDNGPAWIPVNCQKHPELVEIPSDDELSITYNDEETSETLFPDIQLKNDNVSRHRDEETPETMKICDDDIKNDEETKKTVFNMSEWIHVERRKHLEPIEIPSDDELSMINNDEETSQILFPDRADQFISIPVENHDEEHLEPMKICDDELLIINNDEERVFPDNEFKKDNISENQLTHIPVETHLSTSDFTAGNGINENDNNDQIITLI